MTKGINRRRNSMAALSLNLAIFVIANSAVGIGAAGNPGGPSQSGYHILRTFDVGGDGGWDYLTMDSSARRLYISRGTRVMVLDADTGEKKGEIPNTNGVHGIALAPKHGRGFTSNGADSTVTIFDLNTLAMQSQVKVGNHPDAIIYDSGSDRVFTFNAQSEDTTAVDAGTGKVAGTIPLGGKPEFAAADGKGMVFVNIEDKNEVVAFDSKKLSVKARWPIAPGESASGLSIDQANGRLFIGCHNLKMIVMDTSTGKVLADLPIGRGVDATSFDPGTGLAFSSNGDGTLTVVHEDSPSKFSLLENATTATGARTMAVDLKTHNVLLVTAKFGPAPAPTADRPHPRPAMIPGSFYVLVVGK
jgi:YVTN family beta-propeller protein